MFYHVGVSNDQFALKSPLEDGWLDLGVGEAKLVRKSLVDSFGTDWLHQNHDASELIYQPSRGYDVLRAELEFVHQRPVVVTVGAKQAAMAALMVARDYEGCRDVGMLAPAWPPLVATVRALGLKPVMCQPEELDRYDCFLLVSPNNPDGETLSQSQLVNIERMLSEAGKFLVHDAVYACEPYSVEPRRAVGDVQIHSAAKMFGMSGLRVGWAVARFDVAERLADAVETLSAGVSGPAQAITARLLARMRANPKAARDFKNNATESLHTARLIIDTANPDVLIPVASSLANGAFAWCWKGDRFDVQKLRTRLVDGAAYGQPSKVRVNLVGDIDALKEFVARTYEV